VRLTQEWLNGPGNVNLRFLESLRPQLAWLVWGFWGGGGGGAWLIAVAGHRSRRVISEMSEETWFRPFTVVVVGSNMLVVFDIGLLYVKR
jgi:hypothetical protein